MVALLPLGWIALQATHALRDIAYWDEIDSAIALLLRLKAGLGGWEFIEQLFAVTNEHRTVTSRLFFAVSYALTGTVNFVWIGVLGNAFILVALGLLVGTVEGVVRRVGLGVICVFMLFHLANYESFLWSGASIDHFQIVALAVAAFVTLARGTTQGALVAMLMGLLATFTLAHGLVIWPIGALMLARERRWRHLIVWSALAVISGLIFFAGFAFNAGHHIDVQAGKALWPILRYWLTVLGAPLALGSGPFATWLGALFIGFVIVRTLNANWPRDRVFVPVFWFVIGSAALIAVGRAEFSHGQVFSRYMILGGLGWSLIVFGWVERWRSPTRPYLGLLVVLPFLMAFNYAGNQRFAADAATFVEHRDQAALRYRQYGKDGHGRMTMHPLPAHASGILARAERAGLYRVPALSELKSFPRAKPSGRIVYYVDELSVNQESAYVAGWAALPDQEMGRDQLFVVLRSKDAMRVYTTVQVRRPDLVNAMRQPGWQLAGFHFVVQRSLIPDGEYEVGFLITTDEGAEYIMSEHRLRLVREGGAILAGAQ